MTRAAASPMGARDRAPTPIPRRALPEAQASRQEGPDAVRPLHHALRLRRRRRDARRMSSTTCGSRSSSPSSSATTRSGWGSITSAPTDSATCRIRSSWGPTWRCGPAGSGSVRWRTSPRGGIPSGWPRIWPSWTTSPGAGSTWASAAASGPTRGRSSTRTPTRGRTRRTASSFARPSRSCGRRGPRSGSPTRARTTPSPLPDTRFAHPRYPADPAWQDGDRVLKLRVTPKPYQRPHPPLWMTVSTDRSVSFAAELGLQPCYWQPPPRRVRQRMELYAELRSRIEGRPVSPSAGQAVLRNLYVAPTMEAARREAEAPILSAFIYNDPFRGREVFTNPGEELPPGTKLDWEFLEPRNLLVGPPEHVAERRARAGRGVRARDPAPGACASGDPPAADPPQSRALRDAGDARLPTGADDGVPGARSAPGRTAHRRTLSRARVPSASG